MLNKAIRYLLVLTVFSSLLACTGNGEHADLYDYIKQIKSRPSGNIEPLPTFRPFEPFIYSAAAKRSPFDRPVEVKRRMFAKTGTNVKPDFSRTKEYLESFDIGAIKMVGNIQKGGVLWALLSDPNGVIHWVKDGNYIGQNHGKIVETVESKIELIEIVSDGLDGWVERPRVIALSE